MTLALLWMSGLARAGQLVVEADTQQLAVGQTIGLYVTFVDVRPDGPPDLSIRGARLAYRGPKQSFVSVNGKSTLTISYTYALTAESEGELVVPALSMKAGGEVLQSRELHLRVKPRASTEGDSSLTASLSAEQAWVGQTLVYSFDFRTKLRVLDRRWTAPTWTGFVPEQIAELEGREYDIAQDGEPWHVVEIGQPLVATTPGAQTIPSAVFTVQVPDRTNTSQSPFGRMGFTNVRNEVFTAQPLSVDVRPLPTEGREGSWSGLVGHFTLDASLSESRVKVGDSVTLTVSIDGDGTLSGWKLPEPPTGAGWRAYDTDPEVSAEVEGGVFHTRGLFKRAIVPESPGQLTLDPLELQVFDPSVGGYVTLRTPPLTLSVQPGEQASAVASFAGPGDARQDVAALGEDILPVHTRVSTSPTRLRPRLAVGVALAPWLVLGGLALTGYRARWTPREDPRKLLRARLDTVEATPDALESVFREALSLALKRPAAGIDRAALEGLDGGLREEATAIYADLEASRYGAGASSGLRERVCACARRLMEVR